MSPDIRIVFDNFSPHKSFAEMGAGYSSFLGGSGGSKEQEALAGLDIEQAVVLERV